MRMSSTRFLAVLAGALIFVAVAAPAMAQDIPRGARDPFIPLVTQDSGTIPSGTTVTAPGTGTTSGAPDTGISGGLSTTGADTSPWLATAYVLLSAGIAAVAWARIRSPQKA